MAFQGHGCTRILIVLHSVRPDLQVALFQIFLFYWGIWTKTIESPSSGNQILLWHLSGKREYIWISPPFVNRVSLDRLAPN